MGRSRERATADGGYIVGRFTGTKHRAGGGGGGRAKSSRRSSPPAGGRERAPGGGHRRRRLRRLRHISNSRGNATKRAGGRARRPAMRDRFGRARGRLAGRRPARPEARSVRRARCVARGHPSPSPRSIAPDGPLPAQRAGRRRRPGVPRIADTGDTGRCRNAGVSRRRLHRSSYDTFVSTARRRDPARIAAGLRFSCALRRETGQRHRRTHLNERQQDRFEGRPIV